MSAEKLGTCDGGGLHHDPHEPHSYNRVYCRNWREQPSQKCPTCGSNDRDYSPDGDGLSACYCEDKWHGEQPAQGEPRLILSHAEAQEEDRKLHGLEGDSGISAEQFADADGWESGNEWTERSVFRFAEAYAALKVREDRTNAGNFMLISKYEAELAKLREERDALIRDNKIANDMVREANQAQTYQLERRAERAESALAECRNALELCDAAIFGTIEQNSPTLNEAKKAAHAALLALKGKP